MHEHFDPPECASPAAGDLTVQVRPVDAAGLPTEVVLAAAEVPASRLRPFRPRWVDAEFSVPANVAAGEMLAIVLIPDESPATNGTFAWHDKNMNPYARGHQVTQTSGRWILQPSYDAAFKTFVKPSSSAANAPAPAPSPGPLLDPSPAQAVPPPASPSTGAFVENAAQPGPAPGIVETGSSAPGAIPPLCLDADDDDGLCAGGGGDDEMTDDAD